MKHYLAIKGNKLQIRVTTWDNFEKHHLKIQENTKTTCYVISIWMKCPKFRHKASRLRKGMGPSYVCVWVWGDTLEFIIVYITHPWQEHNLPSGDTHSDLSIRGNCAMLSQLFCAGHTHHGRVWDSLPQTHCVCWSARLTNTG